MNNQAIQEKVSTAEEMGFGVKIDAEDLLLDIKYLIKAYYCATLTSDKNTMKMKFDNGQSFLLKVEES